MKKKFTLINRILALTVMLFAPATAFAAVEKPDSGCPSYGVFQSISAIFKNFNGADPSKGLGTIRCMIYEITRSAIFFAGLIAVIFVLYGAFLYTTSFGDDAKAETAKKTVIWSLAGLLVISAAYVILYTILNEI